MKEIFHGGSGCLGSISGQSGWNGGTGYAFNCLNTGTPTDKVVYKGNGKVGPTEYVYNSSDNPTVDNLNTHPEDIPDILANLTIDGKSIYRQPWVLKDGNLKFDWE